MNTQQDLFLNIIEDYKRVITAWKKRADVLNGLDLGWKPNKDAKLKLENKPFGIGDGLGTTGWCVSASQSLLNDPIFQELLKIRFAKAKLISIDIKEQYFGHCYSGSQNKWHTAIFIEDSGVNFVIDITCRQFGNNFIGKDIWNFATWQEVLRSSNCNHTITDFYNNTINFTPLLNENKLYNTDMLYSEVFNKLHNIITLNNDDRSILTDFFVNQLFPLNNRIINKQLTNEDFNYIKKLNSIFSILPFNSYTKTYKVLEFLSKDAAKNWLEGFLNNDCKSDMFMLTSNSIETNSLISGIDKNQININPSKVGNYKYFIVFEFNNQFGIETKEFFKHSELLIPFNTTIDVVSLFNGCFVSDYYQLLNTDMTIDEINTEMDIKADSLLETDKNNTIWVVINDAK